MKKLLALIMVFTMVTGALTISASAAQSASAGSSAEEVVQNVTNYISAGENIILTIRNFFVNIKYMIQRFSGKNVTVEASEAYDLTIAQDGEDIKLVSDIKVPGAKISKAVDLDLNGHTIICNTFEYNTGRDGTFAVKNGTIFAQGGGDVKVIAPNATLNMSNLTVKIASEDSKFYVDASMHTLNIYENVKILYITQDTVGTITVAGDTRVVVAPAVTQPINIAVAGNNVVIENASTAVHADTLADGSENPDAGKSVISIDIVNNDIDNLIITNKVADDAPVIPVTVPENYSRLINIVDDASSDETVIEVEDESGDDVNLVVTNGKLPDLEHLTVAAGATADTATVTGLSTSILYEYRPCNTTEFTEIPAGSESFTTTEKHLFVRAKAYGNYEASDEYEVKTGLADPVKTVYIGCAEEFRAFSEASKTNNFSGWKIYLTGDIDLNNETWTPIGKSKAFTGTFDGQGHTVSNLYIPGTEANNTANNAQGLFGSVSGGSIKNINIHNANVGGSLYVAALVGKGQNFVIDNVNITGDVMVRGWWYTGTIAGNVYTTITNSHVDVNEGSKVSITGGYAGGIIGFSGEMGAAPRKILENCSSNIDVEGQYNGIGGLVGILHYGTSIVNCTCAGDVINTTYDEGEELPTGGICGTYVSTTNKPAVITNTTFTGTIYHHSDIHPNMAHPLYGNKNNATSVITIDGVVITQ